MLYSRQQDLGLHIDRTIMIDLTNVHIEEKKNEIKFRTVVSAVSYFVSYHYRNVKNWLHHKIDVINQKR